MSTEQSAQTFTTKLRKRVKSQKIWSQKSIVFGLFLLSFLLMSIFLPGFFSFSNVTTLVQSVSILGILGLAMGLIFISRGVDLSLIASLAVPPGIFLTLVADGHSLALAAVAAFGIAILFGLVNGWLVAYAEVSPLFVTLASGLFLSGAGQVFFFEYNTVRWDERLDPIAWIGQGHVFGIPKSVIMFAATSLMVAALLRFTRFGAIVFAVGDNLGTARATGLPTRPVIVLNYMIAALIGVLAGFVLATSLESMPTRIFNTTMIYDVILVVVLGGIGLTGGRGGVSNVIIGTLLIGTLLNGMTIMDLSYAAQNMIKGLILLFVVLANSLANPRDEQTTQQGDI